MGAEPQGTGPAAAPTRHPLEERYNGSYELAIDYALDPFERIQDDVSEGCTQWFDGSTQPEAPAIGDQIAGAAIGLAVGALTGGLGSMLTAGTTSIIWSQVVDAGKSIINGTAGWAWSQVSAQQSSRGSMWAFKEGIRRAAQQVKDTEKDNVRSQMARAGENRWQAAQDAHDGLQRVVMGGTVAQKARDACVDGWLTQLAQTSFGGTETQAEGPNGANVTSTDEDAMRDQIGFGEGMGRGVIHIYLNSMIPPDSNPNITHSTVEGLPSGMAAMLAGRKLSDIHCPKVIHGDRMGGSAFFRVFFDENGRYTALTASGSYSFWDDFTGNGGYQPTGGSTTDDWGGADDAGPEHAVTGGDSQNGGRLWLKAYGEARFGGQRAPNLDTGVLWGIAALHGQLASTNFGVSGSGR